MYSKQKGLNFGQYVPNDKVLNKKVPENPKYRHVKPAIDTGNNVRKQIDELKEKQKNCQHKKNEVFKRIKFSTFIKLTLAVATDLLMNESITVHPESSQEMPKAKSVDRRSIANVLMGIGELDVANEKRKVFSSPLKPSKQMPYLLLDVRDREAFSQCHIITAKSYPSAMLSRSAGYEIEELKQFKNYPHNLIILYDEDEVIAVRVATTLVERGYENVFLLSGGLKLALEVCPYGLTTSCQTFPPVHMFTQGATSDMQKSAPKTRFSKEDIEVIERNITCYPSKVDHPAYSSQFSQSTRTGSVASSRRSSALDNRSVPSHASSISGRHSACSSINTEQMHLPSTSSRSSRLAYIRPNSFKSTEQLHTKPATNEKSKLRKAPWK